MYIHGDKRSCSIKNIEKPIITTAIIKIEYIIYCEVTCETIYLRNIIFKLKVVERNFRTLIICYDNTDVINFSQMSFIYI